MPGSRESGRFMAPCGMSELSFCSRRFFFMLMSSRYDEGTALMPIVTHKNQLPQPVRDQYKFLAPDADKYDLPSDWYIL